MYKNEQRNNKFESNRNKKNQSYKKKKEWKKSSRYDIFILVWIDDV